MNKSKLKVDDLNISKLETVPTDLKEWSDVIKNEIVKNTQWKTKVNSLKKKIPDATTLIHIN